MPAIAHVGIIATNGQSNSVSSVASPPVSTVIKLNFPPLFAATAISPK
jgi:hypothetical protein